MDSHRIRNKKRKLCFVVSSNLTVSAFLKEHIRHLKEHYIISVIGNINSSELLTEHGNHITVFRIPLMRKISLLYDIYSLYRLYRIFRNEKFSIVHSVTPKAGLLSMLAGYLSRTPIRVHTFTGQIWATKSGIKRKLFRFFDKVIAKTATNILIDSKSQREYLLHEGVVTERKSRVLLNGSICGVNIERFSPDKKTRKQVREILGINENATVFLYLGRISRDKGILDLVHAFSDLSRKYQDIYLVIIGPDEDKLQEKIENIGASSMKQIHILGYTERPQDYMAAADIFCLPSYREGFGNVIIEAASTGIPSVGCRIYGVKDAIQEGITGLLYEPHNINDLESKLKLLIEDPTLRKRMGEKASEYARSKFDERDIVIAQKDYYDEIQR